MKIFSFPIRKDKDFDKALNVVVPTKSTESNLFKTFRKNFEGSIGNVDMNIILTVVESSGPEFCYARSVNKGVESQDAEYYLNVNDDVVLFDGSLSTALKNMLTRKDMGIHGAVLQYPNGFIQHGGVGFITFERPKLEHVEWLVRMFMHKAPFAAIRDMMAYKRTLRPVIYHYFKISKERKGIVTGAFHLFDNDTFKKTKGYDEGYAMGFEDIDFCLNAIKAGKKVRLDKRVRGIHLETASGLNFGRLFGKQDYGRFCVKWTPETIMRLIEDNGPLFCI